MERQTKRISVAVFLVSAAFVLSGNSWAAGGINENSVNRCKECHARQAEAFLSGNTHSKVWKARAGGDYSCESCHGPGERHMKERSIESIISFTKESKTPVAEQSKQCLTCHTKTEKLAFWDMGKHKKNDVSCATCHKMHEGTEAVKPTVQTCFGCHKDVRSDANKHSHHPIVEGKVACWDCHNPHGTLAPKMILAETTNQLCYKCHADKRGPYLWEHQPVEDNCLTCHTPHGSTHEKLLTGKSPHLCQDCHQLSGHPSSPYPYSTTAGGVGVPYAAEQFIARGCLNCHTRVHGSNAPDDPVQKGHSGRLFFR